MPAILVVDDDPQILRLLVLAMEDSGFQLLSAADGEEGLRVSRSFADEIHLLLTDFAMPKMNGDELALALMAERPGIEVLVMSGYPDGLKLQPGWHFLRKPFLYSKVKEMVTRLASGAATRAAGSR